jgi:hypothetical protein
MNEGTPEDIRRGIRRRKKGENRRTKFKKKGIEKKPRYKALSEYNTCGRETQNMKQHLKIKTYVRR